MIQIQSSQLGELSVGEEHIIRFSRGILGFEEVTEYILFDIDDSFSYLQSVENAELAFIVMNPFIRFPDYEFKLSDESIAELGISSDKGIAVRCIVTWNSDPSRTTVNLLAPLVFNIEDQTARQIVLQDSVYQTRHSLPQTESEES